MQSLEQEKEHLEDRFESLDPTELRNAVLWGGGTILLSVVVPLSVYFLHTVDATIPVQERFAVLEPYLVGFLWVIGIILVFEYLWSEITTESIALDED